MCQNSAENNMKLCADPVVLKGHTWGWAGQLAGCVPSWFCAKVSGFLSQPMACKIPGWEESFLTQRPLWIRHRAEGFAGDLLSNEISPCVCAHQSQGGSRCSSLPFFKFFLVFLLFIYAYNVWVISPRFPHPFPYLSRPPPSLNF
jgi:hypothetical protein